MLLEFGVANFRSYHQAQVLRLVAGADKELKQNTIPVPKAAGPLDSRALRSIAIYGANASGKSNLVRALSAVQLLIARSAGENPESGFDIKPFGLSGQSAQRPRMFFFAFVMNDLRHEYRLSVAARYVVEEELVCYRGNRRQLVFRRRGNLHGEFEWRFGKSMFQRDRALERRTKQNALFLTVAAKWNHPYALPIYDWFCDIRIHHGEVYQSLDEKRTTRMCFEDPKFRFWAEQFLRIADDSIVGILLRKSSRRGVGLDAIGKLGQSDSAPTLFADVVREFPGTKRPVIWSLTEESGGTRRLYGLLVSLYRLLRHGDIVVIDEIDASLHPLLSRKVIHTVNDPKLNKRNGQLIFTTHDSSLLDLTLLRKDQICLASKDERGATHLESMSSYKVREDEPLQKGYLAGRYGGIPKSRSF